MKGIIRAGWNKNFEFIWVISKERKIIGIGRRIKTILTSYDTVWAIARSPPRRAYFELEAQPALRMV